MPRMIGGRYEVLGELGRGGMGVVEKVLHAELEQIRALKLLAENMLDRPEVVARFRSEARTMARLRHDNIVRIYDFDIDRESGRYFLAMECIEGPTLAQYLRARGRLELREALAIARQIASALAYAHAHGVTAHRDVKPSNIFLKETNPPVALLADFGIAKVDNSAMTQTDVNIATPRYGAPEQQGLRRGNQRMVVDARADVFALGLVLYEMIEGRAFFAEFSHAEIVGELVYRKEPIIPEFSVPVPPSTIRMITRAISRDPDDRYPRMSDFFQEIDQCLRSENTDETAVVPGRRDGIVLGESDDDIAQQILALQDEQKRRQAQQTRAQAEAARDRALAVDAANLAAVEYEEASGQLRAASAALQASQFGEAQRLLREAMRVFEGATEAAKSRAVAQAEEARRDALRAHDAAVEGGAPTRAKEIWARAENALARADKEARGAAPVAAAASFREAHQLYGEAVREVRTREREAIDGIARAAAAARDAAVTNQAERLVAADFAAATANLARAREALDASRLDEARALYDGALRAFRDAGALAHRRGQVEQARATATTARDAAGSADAETDAPTLMSEADHAWSAAETDAAADRHRESAAGFATAERFFLAAAERARQRRHESATAAAGAAQAARDRATAVSGAEPASRRFTEAAALYAKASAAMERGEPRAAVALFEQATEAFSEAASDAMARRDVATVRAAAQSSRAAAARAGCSDAPSEADEAERAWRDADQAFTAGDLPTAREGFVRAEKLYRRAAEAAERARRTAELEAAREAERAARAKAERETREAEQAARAKAERETREAERAARAKAERETREAERAAREKAERETREAERAAREKAERETREAEQAARERAEREAREADARRAEAKAAAETHRENAQRARGHARQAGAQAKAAALLADGERHLDAGQRAFASEDYPNARQAFESATAALERAVTAARAGHDASSPSSGDETRVLSPADDRAVTARPHLPGAAADDDRTQLVARGPHLEKPGRQDPRTDADATGVSDSTPTASAPLSSATTPVPSSDGERTRVEIVRGAVGVPVHDSAAVTPSEAVPPTGASRRSVVPLAAGVLVVLLAAGGVALLLRDEVVPEIDRGPAATVTLPPPPPADVQPTWKVLEPAVPELTVKVGDAAEFSATLDAVGTAAPVLRWTVDGEEVGRAARYRLVPEAKHAGTTLDVTVVGAIDDATLRHKWRVLVPAANSAPTIVRSEPAAETIVVAADAREIRFALEASDPDVTAGRDHLTYVWTRTRNGQQEEETGTSSTFVLRDPRHGDVVTARLHDDAGAGPAPRSWRVEVEVEVALNQPPRIVSANPSSTSIRIDEGASQQFGVQVKDPDKGDRLTYRWTLDGQDVGTAATWRFTSEPGVTGRHTVALEVADSKGLKDTRQWSLETTPSEFKLVNPMPRGPIELEVGETEELRVATRGGAGQQLTYGWSIDGGPPKRTATGRFDLPDDLAEGSHTVRVTAEDAKGQSTDPHHWTAVVRATPPPTTPPTIPPPNGQATSADARQWVEDYKRAWASLDVEALIRLGEGGANPAGFRAAIEKFRDELEVQIVNAEVRPQAEGFVVSFVRKDSDRSNGRVMRDEQKSIFLEPSPSGGLVRSRR